MLIREVAGADPDINRLVALSQFLLGRAEDTDAQKTISVGSFLNLAANMGISLTRDRLIDLIQQPPLNGVISNVQGDDVVFQGSEAQVTDTMTVDQAQKTVDSMAKRAIDIK